VNHYSLETLVIDAGSVTVGLIMLRLEIEVPAGDPVVISLLITCSSKLDIFSINAFQTASGQLVQFSGVCNLAAHI
jgi:hypothetical protein